MKFKILVKKIKEGWASSFWSKVEKSDGCWIWKGWAFPKIKNHSNYGRFMMVQAHRISWF